MAFRQLFSILLHLYRSIPQEDAKISYNMGWISLVEQES